MNRLLSVEITARALALGPFPIIYFSSGNQVFRYNDSTQELSVYAGCGGELYPLGDGGPAIEAAMRPVALATDVSGNLFIADFSHQRIRRVDVATGLISTIAGNGSIVYSGDGGPALDAGIGITDEFFGFDVDQHGSVYFPAAYGSRIRKIDAASGTISLFAGGGDSDADGTPASAVSLNSIRSVRFNKNGDLLAAAYDSILRLDANTGLVYTVAGGQVPGYSGDGGLAANAAIHEPTALTFDSAGNLLFSDSRNNRVRRIDAATGIISTLWWFGSETPYRMAPIAMANDAAGRLYATMTLNGSDPLSTFNVEASSFTPAVGGPGLTPNAEVNGVPATSSGIYNSAFVEGRAGNLLIGGRTTRNVDRFTGTIDTFLPGINLALTDIYGSNINFAVIPNSLAQEKSGAILMTASGYDGSSGDSAFWLLRVDPASGSSEILVSGGRAPRCCLPQPSWGEEPHGVTLDAAGSIFYIDRLTSPLVKRIDIKTGSVIVVADQESVVKPESLSFDAVENLYIADAGGNRIRKQNAATGEITTVAGNGNPGFGGDGGLAKDAMLSSPAHVVVDAPGNLYIADYGNHRIRRVDAASGIITTIAGTGIPGFSGDGASASDAWLHSPSRLAIDGNTLFMLDSGNYRVRAIGLNGIIGDFTLGPEQGSSDHATLDANGQASYSLTLSPVWGYSGEVSFICAGIPRGTNCSLTPAEASLSGSPLRVGVTIHTDRGVLVARELERHDRQYMRGMLFSMSLVMISFAGTVRTRRTLLCLAVVTLLVMAGCGGGQKRVVERGSYTVVILATSGQITRTANLTLTVQ